MTRFLIRRLLGAIPLLLGVAVLSFVFMQLAPGGPDAMFARNARMTEEALQAIRHNMGLDRPVHEQLVIWLGNLARGDLGISYTQYRPVSEVIWDVVPNTLLVDGHRDADLAGGRADLRRARGAPPVRLLRQRSRRSSATSDWRCRSSGSG